MTGLPAHLMSVALMADASGSEEAVVAGRKALDHWGRYPWYDAKSDGLQPMDLSPSWWERWFSGWQGPSWSPSLPHSLLQWVAWILIALAIGLLIYAVVRTYLARRAAGSGGSRGKAQTDEAEDRRRVEALPLPGIRGQSDLLAEAERQYRLGHYGQAVVCLFSYQLIQLDKRQLIRMTKGKTNRQYLRELGPRRPLRGLLEQTMVVFEDAFFGQHAIDRVRFESCWTRLNEFEALAAEGLA